MLKLKGLKLYEWINTCQLYEAFHHTVVFYDKK